MNYNVVTGETIEELIRRVNQYEEIGWIPTGGVAVTRERINGPCIYIQAMVNQKAEGKVEYHRRGRPPKFPLDQEDPAAGSIYKEAAKR